MLTVQVEVRNQRRAIEILARSDRMMRVSAQDLARVIAVRVIRNIREAPFKGAHDPVFLALRKMYFARAY
jgi:hypothetical protein